MSQYVNFYVKKDDTWVFLFDYSRNNPHYEMIENEIPYGKLVPLTGEILRAVFANIREEKESKINFRKTNEREIEIIAAMPNPVDEKLESICSCNGSISWADEELENLEQVHSFYSLMAELVDTGDWMHKTDEFVWVGIEAAPPGEENE